MKKNTLVLIYSLLFGLQLNADVAERKKYHFLISPWVYNKNFELQSREIDNSVNLQFLYGLTNNLYIGASYSIGKKGENSLETVPTTSLSTTRIYQYSTSKNSETVSLNFNYFIWKIFFTSFNLGMEKGFTINRNNYAIIRGNNFTPQPFEHKTIFDDRSFASFGLGFRHEIFTNLLLSFEYQRGLIESGKVNQHFTYNPEFFQYNLPYVLEIYLIGNIISENSLRNAQYEQFFLSAGLAF